VADGGTEAIHRAHALNADSRTAAWYRYDPDRDVLTLDVYVQPNASRTEATGLHGGKLKVRVAAPPVDDRANALLQDFLKTKLDLPVGRVMIRRGGRGRSKTIEISQPGPALLDSLKQLLQP
jgi:uncharacterized protein (TIGR00251 family)